MFNKNKNIHKKHCLKKCQRSNAFNPFAVPNTIAVYDGDVNCSSANWRDRTGANQITFANAPTYNAAGLNGHGTVLFNGTNQNGAVALTINYPFTMYIVLRQVTWTDTERILSDNNIIPNIELYQADYTPNIRLETQYNSGDHQSLILNQFKVLTIMQPNTTFWNIRINKTLPVTFQSINFDLSGLVLASTQAGTLFSNVEFAYMIIRNVGDPTVLQDNFITFLMSRFAIT